MSIPTIAIVAPVSSWNWRTNENLYLLFLILAKSFTWCEKKFFYRRYGRNVNLGQLLTSFLYWFTMPSSWLPWKYGDLYAAYLTSVYSTPSTVVLWTEIIWTLSIFGAPIFSCILWRNFVYGLSPLVGFLMKSSGVVPGKKNSRFYKSVNSGNNCWNDTYPVNN